MRPPYGPFPFSPISARARFRFANGARVAVWLIPNLEFFPLGNAIPPAAGGSGQVPDIPSWSRRDYGNRVGFARMAAVMDRHGVRGTAALNSDMCRHHPEIVAACLARGWEIMGHNETNTIRLNAVEPHEEAAIVTRTLDTIAAATGQRPSGWLGAGLQETWDTLDHLHAAGLRYVADWCNDDQPYLMRLPGDRRIASVPYSFEINDKGAYETEHLTPPEFAATIVRHFDVLYREGAHQARVLPIALHPYITGVAHRIDALDAALAHIRRHDEVWFATGAEIAAEARDL